VNIYKELQNDIQGFSIPKHGNLTGWAKQGTYFVFVLIFQSIGSERKTEN
jgi:uracil-DNA glycosylase